MNKPKKGQIVFIEPTGYSSRREGNEIIETKVVKSGNKYFTVDHCNYSPSRCIQFHISNWRQKTEFSPRWDCHESMQSYLDKKEYEKLNSFFTNFFEWTKKHKLNLDQLRRMSEIANEE
jgi:hypothetical protein